jgi:hypothetical protein
MATLVAWATDSGVGFKATEIACRPQSSRTFAVVIPAAIKAMVGFGTKFRNARAALGDLKITAEY